jgi:hypothetical protein
MPRNMSFAMTTEQIRLRKKTVTRRFGWWFLKAGDIIQPIEKVMGLKKGEKIKKIGGPILVISSHGEPLCSIDESECIKEGFPEYTPDDFVTMLMHHYKCDSAEEINRIEFEFI